MKEGSRAHFASVFIIMVSLSLFPRLMVAQDLDVKALVGEDWYGLYMNGEKVGYAVEEVAIEADGTVRVGEDAHFAIKMSDVKQDMHILVNRLYKPEGDLLSIHQEVADTQGVKRFDARVEGESMTLSTDIGGAVSEKTVPKPKENLKDALQCERLVGKDAKVGDKLAYSLFEPMYERELEGVSRIVEVEEKQLDGALTRVFKIESILQPLGITSISCVAETGVVLEDTIGGVIQMRLEPKEVAQDVNYCNDVIVSNAARLDAPIAEPRTRDSLRLHITGPLDGNHAFNDERQQMTPADGGYDFSAKRIVLNGFTPAQLPISDRAVEEWIKPSLFVQSDHPKLQDKAREIAGDEKDSFAVSSKLCSWVYTTVKTTFSAQLSNALEVLEHPEGDCTEHSILFVGLARAAGLPAREVAGLIYVDNPSPAFYFHQWAEVWIGKWIDVDPTFNQPLADVTHIKLSEGDLFEQVKLTPTIGRLGITVTEESENREKEKRS